MLGFGFGIEDYLEIVGFSFWFCYIVATSVALKKCARLVRRQRRQGQGLVNPASLVRLGQPGTAVRLSHWLPVEIVREERDKYGALYKEMGRTVTKEHTAQFDYCRSPDDSNPPHARKSIEIRIRYRDGSPRQSVYRR